MAMRRLLLLAALGWGVYLLLARRRVQETVTIGYVDGSSITLAEHTGSAEILRVAARGVLRA
jgi:hypothetical protein